MSADDNLTLALKALSFAMKPAWEAAGAFDAMSSALEMHNTICRNGEACETAKGIRQQQANDLSDMISHMEEGLAAARELATLLPKPSHLPPEWSPKK